MSTSVVFAARNSVLSLITTALAAQNVDVVGGSKPVATGYDTVYVGADDLTEELNWQGWVNAAEANQDWHSNRSRLEDFTVKCVALSWSGAGDFETLYSTMATYMGLIEASVLTNWSLNLPSVSSTEAGMVVVGVDQTAATAGVALKCRFEVRGIARVS